MNKSSNWHFARPELAERYLQFFTLGLTSARGLFARRRMGKTEFLKQDFIPLAQKKGYLVTYINLWDLQTDPETALVSELYKTIEPKGWEKIVSSLKSPASKFKATGKIPSVVEGSVEIDLKKKKEINSTILAEAMNYFEQKKRPMIFVIDEAQVLAHEENTHFAHALRSALDIRKELVKVIFAGSSENTLRRMFGVPSEPFYNWAPLEPFELLGQSFVEAMVDRVNKVSKFPLSVKQASAAFERLKKTPEFFRRYIEHYIINPSDKSDGALKATIEKVFSDKNFIQQWEGLLSADQVILVMLSQGKTDMHSKEALFSLGQGLGIADGVNKNTVQNGLRRLAKKNIITKLDHGTYRFEDEAFEDWVKHRE